MRIIDMRSDTVTQPTPSMRRAMAEAEVGDDVFGEDPTVRHLEEKAAAMLGKEAGVFVTSGTMANLVCQLTHCGRGDEMILGDQAHIFFYEQGGSAALGGIHPRIVPNRSDGTIRIADIEAAIRGDDVHFPRTRLIALENTHNRCYGSPIEPSYMAEVGKLAKSNHLKIHVDGARIFNAAIALEVDVRELTRHADSVSCCLSKGLGAPVGSVVCGSVEFIAGARRARKILGGGMRQAGVIAAAGIVALDEMVDRLAIDHENARKLARGLSEIHGIGIDPDVVKTDIVFFDIEKEDLSTQTLVAKLADEGVRVLALGPKRLRAVTNHHITSDDIDRVLEIMKKIV